VTDTDTDTEFSATAQKRLRKLEEMMLDRGYVRDQHGFWILPGAEGWLAIKQRTED
jgi:hypothetical protein